MKMNEKIWLINSLQNHVLEVESHYRKENALMLGAWQEEGLRRAREGIADAAKRASIAPSSWLGRQRSRGAGKVLVRWASSSAIIQVITSCPLFSFQTFLSNQLSSIVLEDEGRDRKAEKLGHFFSVYFSSFPTIYATICFCCYILFPHVLRSLFSKKNRGPIATTFCNLDPNLLFLLFFMFQAVNDVPICIRLFFLYFFLSKFNYTRVYLSLIILSAILYLVYSFLLVSYIILSIVM